jgi:hypothetical protein
MASGATEGGITVAGERTFGSAAINSMDPQAFC